MTVKTSVENPALVGALVADAATMGLHWMYDQEQIVKVAQTGELLFRQPDANTYKDQKAFFAHTAKRVGQNSHYGESLRVVAKSIVVWGGYAPVSHRQIFFDTFGPCGSYHGFADRPDDISEPSGTDDDQLPALSSIPALFACGQGSNMVEQAVAVTSTNREAISGARVLYDCLERVGNGEKLSDALVVSISFAEPALAALLNEALALPAYDPLAAANQFGLPCHIKQGLPVAWHILKHATDFESAVRDNIRCGGDSCGRSMAVGSVAGLVFGVPDEMKAKMDNII